jgi:hypothetical protein
MTLLRSYVKCGRPSPESYCSERASRGPGA